MSNQKLDGSYSRIYIENLKKSNLKKLKEYAKDVYINFEKYAFQIRNSNLKFTYIY